MYTLFPLMATNLPRGAGGQSANDDAMLRAADRRKLERLAARLEADRVAMRKAMREAQERGASLREIAEAASMSHTGVAKWLKQPPPP